MIEGLDEAAEITVLGIGRRNISGKTIFSPIRCGS